MFDKAQSNNHLCIHLSVPLSPKDWTTLPGPQASAAGSEPATWDGQVSSAFLPTVVHLGVLCTYHPPAVTRHLCQLSPSASSKASLQSLTAGASLTLFVAIP